MLCRKSCKSVMKVQLLLNPAQPHREHINHRRDGRNQDKGSDLKWFRCAEDVSTESIQSEPERGYKVQDRKK
ncbi:hypothetical protein XENTR_v10001414 [Xenopus tropicalis]|nr:hypothetical protein XENTR_v10001414 [Xenopus tropicalis]